MARFLYIVYPHAARWQSYRRAGFLVMVYLYTARWCGKLDSFFYCIWGPIDGVRGATGAWKKMHLADDLCVTGSQTNANPK